MVNAPAAAKKPPGPEGLPILGDILRFGGEQNILFHFTDAWREFGDLCRLRLGPYTLFLVADPENVHRVLVTNQSNYIKGQGYAGFRLLVGNGLVTSDGDLWQRQRRLMQPSFRPRAIEGFVAMMGETTARRLQTWRASGPSLRLNMDDEMAALTMSIISKTIFGVDLAARPGPISQAFQSAFAFVTARTLSAFSFPLAWPLPSHRRFRHDRKTIDNFVRQQIDAGRHRTDGTSLIDILVQTRDPASGQGLSDQQIRDEAVTLFLAGFETTARTLTWVWYLLSLHPEWCEPIRDEALSLGDGPIELANLEDLPTTRAVIQETLRLYPPTGLLARQVVDDDRLGGFHVPAGSIVMLIPYSTQRHPRVWAEPDRFDPSRFLNGTRPPRSSYIPFAGGPRVCLGNHFAMAEMTIVVAMIIAGFEIHRPTSGEIGHLFRGSICPTEPLIADVISRRANKN